MSTEARRARRFRHDFPLEIDPGSGAFHLGVARDVSAVGMRVMTGLPLENGQPVRIRFRIDGHQLEEYVLSARAARVQENFGDMWPVMVALELDEPQPEIEQLLHFLTEDD